MPCGAGGANTSTLHFYRHWGHSCFTAFSGGVCKKKTARPATSRHPPKEKIFFALIGVCRGSLRLFRGQSVSLTGLAVLAFPVPCGAGAKTAFTVRFHRFGGYPGSICYSGGVCKKKFFLWGVGVGGVGRAGAAGAATHQGHPTHPPRPPQAATPPKASSHPTQGKQTPHPRQADTPPKPPRTPSGAKATRPAIKEETARAHPQILNIRPPHQQQTKPAFSIKGIWQDLRIKATQ